MNLSIVEIPTGNADQVLCLQAHVDTVWAGLYATPAAGAPLEIGVASRRTGAGLREGALVVGGQRFRLRSAPMRHALRWLDRHGVRVKGGLPS